MMLAKMKSWQLFILIIVPLIISYNSSNTTLQMIMDITAYVFLFCWFLFVGINLNDALEESESKNDMFFIINCFYLLVFCILSAIFKSNGENEVMPAYIQLLVLYFGVAFFYVLFFLSKTYSVVQKKKEFRRDSLYSSQTIFFFFFIFPVGIWFLQPKVNEYLRS